MVAARAAAYAETGDFGKAVHWQKEALARLHPTSPQRQEFKNRLKLYRDGKPFRTEPKAE